MEIKWLKVENTFRRKETLRECGQQSKEYFSIRVNTGQKSDTEKMFSLTN